MVMDHKCMRMEINTPVISMRVRNKAKAFIDLIMEFYMKVNLGVVILVAGVKWLGQTEIGIKESFKIIWCMDLENTIRTKRKAITKALIWTVTDMVGVKLYVIITFLKVIGRMASLSLKKMLNSVHEIFSINILIIF